MDRQQEFDLYLDQLQNEEVKTFSFKVAPTFLGEDIGVDWMDEATLSYRAQLTPERLFLWLSGECSYRSPCSFCDDTIPQKITIEDRLFTLEKREFRRGVVDLAPLFREELLLELPHFADCGDRNCSKRLSLAPYLKEEGEEEKKQYPFGDL